MSTWLWKADMFPSLSLGMVAFIFLQIRIPSKSHLCCFSSKFRSSTNMKFCVQFKPLIQIWKVSHRGGSQLAPWVTQLTLKIQGGNSADLFFSLNQKLWAQLSHDCRGQNSHLPLQLPQGLPYSQTADLGGQLSLLAFINTCVRKLSSAHFMNLSDLFVSMIFTVHVWEVGLP